MVRAGVEKGLLSSGRKGWGGELAACDTPEPRAEERAGRVYARRTRAGWLVVVVGRLSSRASRRARWPVRLLRAHQRLTQLGSAASSSMSICSLDDVARTVSRLPCARLASVTLAFSTRGRHPSLASERAARWNGRVALQLAVSANPAALRRKPSLPGARSPVSKGPLVDPPLCC